VNVTDVYVEQLIIGGLVVVILCVIMTGQLPPVKLDETTGIAFLAITYLAGLLYDRIGDTLLERIEKRQRLEFAIEYGEKTGDPFPEDEYRARIYGNEQLVRQYNYLRTRVRLSRGVTTLAPAGTIALLVYDGARSGAAISLVVVAAYALVGALNWMMGKLPRTNDAEDFAAYAARTKPARRWIAYAPALTGLVACAAIMAMIAGRHWPLALAGIALTLLAGWVWIRITGTFLAFLQPPPSLRPVR
jgi:hypothetical protein